MWEKVWTTGHPGHWITSPLSPTQLSQILICLFYYSRWGIYLYLHWGESSLKLMNDINFPEHVWTYWKRLKVLYYVHLKFPFQFYLTVLFLQDLSMKHCTCGFHLFECHNSCFVRFHLISISSEIHGHSFTRYVEVHSLHQPWDWSRSYPTHKGNKAVSLSISNLPHLGP